MRSAVSLLLLIALASCGSHQKSGNDAGKTGPELAQQAPCDESDVGCLNARLMRRIEEDDRQYPKYTVEDALGDWTVVAAIEPIGRRPKGEFVTLYEPRDVWLGSKVNISKDALTIAPNPGVHVTQVENLGKQGDLFPHCTKPGFETDLRHSAGEMEGLVEPWQHFGLQFPRNGRFIIVGCNGGPEYPDDGSGHHAEMSVEEAESAHEMFVYSRDLLIVGWGELEFLLRRN